MKQTAPIRHRVNGHDFLCLINKQWVSDHWVSLGIICVSHKTVRHNKDSFRRTCVSKHLLLETCQSGSLTHIAVFCQWKCNLYGGHDGWNLNEGIAQGCVVFNWVSWLIEGMRWHVWMKSLRKAGCDQQRLHRESVSFVKSHDYNDLWCICQDYVKTLVVLCIEPLVHFQRLTWFTF